MSDPRELRERLERAQGEVKRLTRALADARDTARDGKLEREVGRLAAQIAHHDAHRRETEQHWRAREREWQLRERALRDEVDALRLLVTKSSRELQRAEAHAAKLERRVAQLQARRPAPKLLASLRQALTHPDTKQEVETLRRKVARLEQQLSLQQPRRRR